MEILIKVHNCNDCPYNHFHFEQGFCGNVCKLISGYEGIIPKNGIHPKCPLKSVDKDSKQCYTNNVKGGTKR